MARYLNDLNDAGTLQNADLTIVQQSEVDKKTTLEGIANFVLDKVFPVGAMYIQMPNMDDPSTLGYPGTWTNVSSDYAGAFFRAEGSGTYGSAQVFDNQTASQKDQMQGHWHDYDTKHGSYGNMAIDGASGTGSYNIRGKQVDSGKIEITSPKSDGINSTPRTGSETRPENYTIRIWKRTI